MSTAHNVDITPALSAFNIVPADLDAYKHLTDNIDTDGMEYIPPYAMDSRVFEDFILQRAIAYAAEFLKVPRSLVRYAMKNLPSAKADPHPINPAVYYLHGLLNPKEKST